MPEGTIDPNPFVPYLNSLHSCHANSENALAEFQSCNPFFGFIHVPHPLLKGIQEKLLEASKCHVILTGHAGDGKSTIAVELYKQFTKQSPEAPLSQPMQRRESVTAGGKEICFVKDFSEWSPPRRAELMEEMLDTGGPRFFLISNTGTLLDAFKEYADKSDVVNSQTIESDLLEAMDTTEMRSLEFRGVLFWIVNIAMADNLGIARQIFQRMLARERWEKCASADCRIRCPIYRNVSLIQQNLPIVEERLFLAYRRMFEYGTRLTLRQLGAHMAYMITSGKECHDVWNMSKNAAPPRMTEYMFFNRFFGDDGKNDDGPASQLRAVRAVREQGFGLYPCPTWERKFWLRSRDSSFELTADDYQKDFEEIRKIGAGLPSDESMTEAHARTQVRRAVYFLHRFDQGDDGIYLKMFLNSVMLLNFSRWQTPPGELSTHERHILLRRIMHVLKEHFTGVRLPEGTESADRYLYITLSRRSHNVRQSAQVVLASYPEDDFDIELHEIDNGVGGIRRELQLVARAGADSLRLRLTLPFLDFVMMRNQGEIGKDLQASYIDRLEHFKGQLIRHFKKKRDDDILLVRLRTNHTFHRQKFAVRSGRLEVSDV
ncbi:MAG: hypothetical protein ACE15F_24420 [bacterium]